MLCSPELEYRRPDYDQHLPETVGQPHQVEWLKLRRTSAATRVEWSQTATRLIEELYNVPIKE